MTGFKKLINTKYEKAHIIVVMLVTISSVCELCFSQPVDKRTGENRSSYKVGFDLSEIKNPPVFQSLPQNFEYNSVRCIHKDSKGYMWFGTGYGLIKYDGINLYVYENDPGSASSLSNSSVNGIAEDRYKNLWIATSDGLNLYNREKDNFIHVENLAGEINPLNFNYINSIFLQNDSLLWLGTFTGIYVYNTINHSVKNYTHLADDPHSLSMDHVTCIVDDQNNNLWIGTQNGLNLFIGEKEGFKRFYSESDKDARLSNNITCLTVDLNGYLWAGTSGGGLMKVVKTREGYLFDHYLSSSRIYSLSSNYILSLCADRKGFLWIGTENGGLNRLNISTGFINVFRMEEGNEYSLKSNSIWTLYVDDEERIWIGSYNRGISVIDENFRKFELFQKNIFDKNSLTDNDVTGLAEDSKGNVWIATDGGGICKFDPETRQIINSISNSEDAGYLTNNALQAIICDANDNLWVGTWAGGIDRLNGNGVGIRNYKLEREEGAGNNNVMSLYIDSKGNIWATTAGSGLFRYNKETDKFVPISSRNQSAVLANISYVTTIFEDSYGTLWIGTVYGLGIIHSKNGESYNCTDIFHSSDTTSISSNMVDVIFEDSQKRLWFGTSDKGLNLFNRRDSTFTVFDKKDGLPSNSIKGILEDDQGQLWISTNKGISRFNYAALNFTNYSREDGLNSNEFYARSCLRTKKGEFFFGNENGFNVFYPGNIKNNAYIPPVYLTDFKINNRSVIIDGKKSPIKKHISETTEISLNHKQSSFTIEFVALNYTRSSRNQFCYKLEGFDNEWNCIGTNRSANYTNIKPGNYVFLVKGSNNDGIWNENPTQLQITIKQPYWNTWWAKLFYFLFFAAIVLLYARIRNERINIKTSLKLEHLAREKEHELNESNIQFFTNISHEFRTPLSLIIAPLESLILSAKSKTKEQLLMMYRNANKLLRLTNNLLNFRKLEEGNTKIKVQQGDVLNCIREVSSYFKENLKSRHIDFTINSAESSVMGWFDPEKLETIVLNLLSNAYKYTPDNGRIKIEVNVRTDQEIQDKSGNRISKTETKVRFIEIEVIDNGIGISSDELPYIFDKFYRAKSSELRKGSGTGIGLALVKGYVELHRGTIKAESIPGQETRFIFILPIDRSVYSEDEIVPESEGVLKRTVINDSVKISIQDEMDSPEETFPDEDSPEILIVEDNDELRTFLIKELGKKFKVTQAENGQVGIDRALSDIPDLIVSDIVMPQRGGIDLCKTIKSDLRTCHIPVVLLTAKASVNDQIEGIETGADAYLTKPFSVQFLIVLINQLIESRRKLFAHFSQEVYFMPNKLTDNAMDQKFLQKTVDYIIQNIADNSLSVEDLADHLGLSRSNVYRKIKALTGKTIIEFVRIIRLKQAIKLMETRQYSLAEIAYLTGFSSPSYFTKSFREQYGKPPSEYLPQ